MQRYIVISDHLFPLKIYFLSFTAPVRLLIVNSVIYAALTEFVYTMQEDEL